jgi:hypothetical protein
MTKQTTAIVVGPLEEAEIGPKNTLSHINIWAKYKYSNGYLYPLSVIRLEKDEREQKGVPRTKRPVESRSRRDLGCQLTHVKCERTPNQ